MCVVPNQPHPINMNQWTHVIATRKAYENAKIYYNGVLQPVTSEPWSGAIDYDNKAMFALGKLSCCEWYFKGIIDDVRIYNRALDPTEVLELYSEGTSVNLKSGLVAYYPFNGNANDESGNNHHGIVMGATLTTDRFENINKAYYFDGAITTYIKASASHLPTKDRTISLWINAVMPAYENRYQMVLTYGGYNACSTGNAFNFVIDSWGKNNYGAGGYCGFKPLLALRDDVKSKGKWIHLIYTTSLSGSNIYINGILSANDKNIYLSNTFVDGTDLAIGANILPEGLGLVGTLPNQEPIICNFIGSLDDIRIYNRSMTESEVKALYQETAPASIEPPPVIIPQTSLPNSTNTNLALAIGLSAGLTSGAIVTTALLWKYYKNKKVENKLEEQHFANQIRKLLNLDINNFESTEGKDFIRMIELLKSRLLEKDINVNNMTTAQQNELAKTGAIVISSQNLLVESTNTGCLNVNALFCKQKQLLHEQFQSRIELIVNDMLNEINNKYTLTKHSVEPVILSSIVIEVSSAQLLEHLDRLVGSILSNLIKKGFWLSTNNEHYKTIFKDSLQSSGLFKDYCLLDDLKRSYIRELLVVNITKEFLEIAKVTDNMQALQSTIIDAFEKVIRNEGQLLLEANSKQHSSDADESEKLIDMQTNIEVEMHQKQRSLLFIDRQNNISPSTKEHQTLSDDKPARIIRRRKLSL